MLAFFPVTFRFSVLLLLKHLTFTGTNESEQADSPAPVQPHVSLYVVGEELETDDSAFLLSPAEGADSTLLKCRMVGCF